MQQAYADGTDPLLHSPLGIARYRVANISSPYDANEGHLESLPDWAQAVTT